MSELAETLRKLDALKKSVRAIDGKQVFSKTITDDMHAIAALFFANVKHTLPIGNQDTSKAESLFTQLHDLSRKNPSRQKCLDIFTEARKVLVRLEGQALSQSANSAAGKITKVDHVIIATLDDVCSPASASYRQALQDLGQNERTSWRGSATELRESLRETLDKLAPDKEVEELPNFKFEPNTQRPTMKQKVRFILRNRGMNGGQVATSEDTVKFVEESLGGITRSAYNRSSVSAHTPTTREEVARLHALIRVLLCELLAIQHE